MPKIWMPEFLFFLLYSACAGNVQPFCRQNIHEIAHDFKAVSGKGQGGAECVCKTHHGAVDGVDIRLPKRYGDHFDVFFHLRRQLYRAQIGYRGGIVLLAEQSESRFHDRLF